MRHIVRTVAAMVATTETVNPNKERRLAMKRSHNLASLWLAFAVLFVPQLAWAGTAEGAAKAALSQILAHIKYLMLVHPDHKVLSYAAMVLTLVWLLFNKKVRHLIGRLGGIFLALFLLDNARFAFTFIGGFLGGGVLMLIIILCVISGTVRGLVWGAIKAGFINSFRGLWNMATKVANEKEPSWGWSLVSALLIAFLINGAWASNPTNHYMPSILSSLGGVGVLVWGITHMIWKCGACGHRNLDWNMDEEHCENCRARNPNVEWACACKAMNLFKARGCKKCGKANPYIDDKGKPKRPDEMDEGKWKCSKGHANEKDARRCGRCREPNPKATWDCPAGTKDKPCRTDIPHDLEFCPKCGAGKPEVVKDRRAHQTPRPTTQLAQGKVRCGACGKDAKAGKFCQHCRVPLTTPATATPETSSTNPTASGPRPLRDRGDI